MSEARDNEFKDLINRIQGQDHIKALAWTGSFWEYLDIVRTKPTVTRNAYQRIYDMILGFGTSEYMDSKKRVVRYKFFDDEAHNGADGVFGLDIPLMKLVNTFRSAAMGYGSEKRVILLHGPVGSAKSTIARLLKRGLEDYSKTEEGALYTFEWIDNPKDPHGLLGEDVMTMATPMHEEPLLLIPEDMRGQFITELNRGLKDDFRIKVKGDLCPASRFIFKKLFDKYNGNINKVLEFVRVKRLVLSEKDRIGIGTFQPKDEKNQDSTELTGDINYRKIAEYGSDSDPRAFNFDGEFNIANRGLVEFVEVLKLDVAFLYDLLGASQEHMIKPKKFAQTHIDEVILGHTNEPEYRKLQNNEFMEALRDRTIKIDIPYITKLKDEVRIYQKDFNSQKIRGIHIAPHTIQTAAMWAIMTRMESPKKSNLTKIQKLKLYDGKAVAGYTEDNVKELRKETIREGFDGISPRYIQDKLSNAIVNNKHGEVGCVNPFMVMNELESGLKHHSLLSSEDKKAQYRELLQVIKQEYEDIIKSEVQRAISSDESGMSRLCGNYIDNVKAYTQRERVRNPFTGRDDEPDERLMRAIEEKIEIPESRKDDFRREIMNYIGALAIEGKKFDYKTNERLHKALELKMFEDQKDTIKLTTFVSNVVDKTTQEKIDVVKSRLIKESGYCEICAANVLNYVSSIFARGDAKTS